MGCVLLRNSTGSDKGIRLTLPGDPRGNFRKLYPSIKGFMESLGIGVGTMPVDSGQCKEHPYTVGFKIYCPAIPT